MIVGARQFTAQVLQQPILSGTAEAKWIEECIERSLVRVAKEIVQTVTPLRAYDQLVDLYERQPRLGTRTSTSVLQQAYSTPLPIALLASTLAGIDSQTAVYEPTAGNGALLLSANSENATVNELNPDRASDLQHQGYRVTTRDATLYLPEKLQDVVILNPPFNSILENGKPKRFQTGAYLSQPNGSGVADDRINRTDCSCWFSVTDWGSSSLGLVNWIIFAGNGQVLLQRDCWLNCDRHCES